MTKYRIVEVSRDLFEPQYRFLWFYLCWYEYVNMHYSRRARFLSLTGAKAFISSVRIERSKVDFKNKVVWEGD